ncbi:MAG: transposase [Mycobacterium sp.]|nr:transposase [Mycobacterium sp.]
MAWLGLAWRADRPLGAGRPDGRTGALVVPMIDRMAALLKAENTRLYIDETTALDPGPGRTKAGSFRAMLQDSRGWGGPLPPGVFFDNRPSHSSDYADEILDGFDGTIQGEAYGG